MPAPELQARPESMTLPPIRDEGSLAKGWRGWRRPNEHHPVMVGSCGPKDRPYDKAELPKGWSAVHDRAICAMDRKGYEPDQLIRTFRQYFPDMHLTEGAVGQSLAYS